MFSLQRVYAMRTATLHVCTLSTLFVYTYLLHLCHILSETRASTSTLGWEPRNKDTTENEDYVKGDQSILVLVTLTGSHTIGGDSELRCTFNE